MFKRVILITIMLFFITSQAYSFNGDQVNRIKENMKNFISAAKEKTSIFTEKVKLFNEKHLAKKMTGYVGLSNLNPESISQSEIGFIGGLMYRLKDNNKIFLIGDISYHDWDENIGGIGSDFNLVSLNFGLAYKVYAFNTGDLRDGIFLEAGFGKYWLERKTLGISTDDEDFAGMYGMKFKHRKLLGGYRRHEADLMNSNWTANQWYVGYSFDF